MTKHNNQRTPEAHQNFQELIKGMPKRRARDTLLYLKRKVTKLYPQSDSEVLNVMTFKNRPLRTNFPTRKTQPIREHLLKLQQYSNELDDENIMTVLRAVKCIRMTLSVEHIFPIEEVMESGALEKISNLLVCESVVQKFGIDPKSYLIEELIYEAMWTITNVASGSEEDTQKVVDLGCLPNIISALKMESFRIKYQAVWALGNIITDSIENRTTFINQNGIEIIIGLISIEKAVTSLDSLISWIFSALVKTTLHSSCLQKILPHIITFIRNDPSSIRDSL